MDRGVSSNKVQSLSWVDLLPLPVQSIKIVVVQVEHWVSRTAINVCHNAASSLVSRDMRVKSHAAIKFLKVRDRIAIIDVRAGAEVQSLGHVPLSGKSVVGSRLERSDVQCAVCKWSSGDTVVDLASVASKILIFPHVGLEEVS